MATVEWLRGNRLMSTLMRNAGLGIDKVGVKERCNITYKAGEVVDEARVLRAINSMIADLDAANDECEISSPKVISITTKIL